MVLDYNSATYPFQDADIAPLDALIYRAKTKDIHAVMVDGEVIFQEGRFTHVNRDAVLAQIAEAMSVARDSDEMERHWLREQVFPVVEAFYSDYLQNTEARTPFYRGSSKV